MLRFFKRGRFERVFLGNQAIRKRRQRPFVGSNVQMLARNLLKRHITNSTTCGFTTPRRIQQRRKTKIGYFHFSVGRNKNVVGLNIQMQHRRAMRHTQRRGNAVKKRRQRVEGNVVSIALHQLRKRNAFDVFHNQIRVRIAQCHVIDGNDVFVFQKSRRARFIDARNVRKRVKFLRSGIVKSGTLGVNAGKKNFLERNFTLNARIPRQ